MDEEPSFWEASWTWVKRVFRWVAAPLPALLLVVGALVLLVLGVKNIQIGGLLGKLFGKSPKDPKGPQAVEVANSIPEDRVDSNGNLIQPGNPDSIGHTQAKVVPIEKPGLFDDPAKVKVTAPDGETVELELPDGLKAKDVDKVIIVQPDVYTVTVKDSSGVEAEDIDSLLDKFGKS